MLTCIIVCSFAIGIIVGYVLGNEDKWGMY